MDAKTELLFIAEVENRPAIYDKSNPQYQTQKPLKTKFEEIKKKLKVDLSSEELIIKWKQLRNKYIRLRNLDPKTGEATLSKNEDFLKQMSFLDDFDLDEPVVSVNSTINSTLNDSETDPYYEDEFIESIKEHPIIFNIYHPDNKRTKIRSQVWEQLSEKFGENERKLQLKWKNLKRKYILMRYPQSSRNSVTQKRKIRYSPKFVEKMKFLDRYLEYSQRYSPVDDGDVYQNCLKKMKLEHPEDGDQVKIETNPDVTNLVDVADDTEEIMDDESENIGQEETENASSWIRQFPSCPENDPDNGQFTLSVGEENEEQQQEEDEESYEIIEDPIETGFEDEEESATPTEIKSEPIDRRSENEIFCLSLVDSINRLSYQKQLKVKSKIWNLLAEES